MSGMSRDQVATWRVAAELTEITDMSDRRGGSGREGREDRPRQLQPHLVERLLECVEQDRQLVRPQRKRRAHLEHTLVPTNL